MPAQIEKAIEVARGQLAVLFGFTLALNAHRGVGQGLQARQGNLLAAAVALAVIAVAHPLQRRLNVRQFAAFDLGQLRADFILGRIQRGIDHVARRLVPQFLEHAQVAGQCRAEGVAALDQDLPQGSKRVFASHGDHLVVHSTRAHF